MSVIVVGVVQGGQLRGDHAEGSGRRRVTHRGHRHAVSRVARLQAARLHLGQHWGEVLSRRRAE